MEKVRESLPDLYAPFPLGRFADEGFNHYSKATRERIKGALLLNDVRVFEQASFEGFIGWSYAFSDFVSELPSNPVIFSFFLECLLIASLLFCLGVWQ